MKKIVIYQCDDGTRFDSEKQAAGYAMFEHFLKEEQQ